MYIAAKVAHIPATQPRKAVLKQGRDTSEIDLMLPFFRLWSISNLRHMEMKIPGITISPKPSMLNFSTPSALRQGKSSLMGMSRFLATVTITSVPYTQKMSQKNSSQSSRFPTLKLVRLMFLRATMENKTPNTLLRAQYFVTQQRHTGMAQIMVQIMLALEISKSSISSTLFTHLWVFTCFRQTFMFSGKASSPSKRLEVEMIVARQNWIVIRVFTRSLLMYLWMRQNPSKKIEANIGKRRASFCPMLQESWSFSAATRLAPDCLNLEERMTPIQTQAQLLMRSCGKTGSK